MTAGVAGGGAETPAGKVYRNERYGYEVRYPQSWFGPGSGPGEQRHPPSIRRHHRRQAGRSRNAATARAGSGAGHWAPCTGQENDSAPREDVRSERVIRAPALGSGSPRRQERGDRRSHRDRGQRHLFLERGHAMRYPRRLLPALVMGSFRARIRDRRARERIRRVNRGGASEPAGDEFAWSRCEGARGRGRRPGEARYAVRTFAQQRRTTTRGPRS